MKFSISKLLFSSVLIGLGLGWFTQQRRAGELQIEVDRLRTQLGPDDFAYKYHSNPNRSLFGKDPLASVDRQTGDLYKALIAQPKAWSSGLNQYLGIDRIREEFDPSITMTVWWNGEVKDSDGNRFFVYLADRKRERHTKNAPRLHSSYSAYIVTDTANTLVHWNGCEIDALLVTETELLSDSFPAGLKYREWARHNGDSSIEIRKLTKTGIVR